MVPNNFDIWQQVLGFLKDINIMEMVILIYFSGVSRILLEKLKVIQSLSEKLPEDQFFFMRFDQLLKIGLSQIINHLIIQPLTIMCTNHQIRNILKPFLEERDCYALSDSSFFSPLFLFVQVYLMSCTKNMRYNILFIEKKN